MQVKRAEIIETLTGVRSYKKNYYIELQQKIEEVTLKNKQLEIINKLVKSFKLDLPINQIINALAVQLKRLIPFDDINLSMLVDGECKSVTNKLGYNSQETACCTPNKICRYVIKHGITVRLPEQASELGMDTGTEIGSGVYIPLTVKNKVIGILGISSRINGVYSTQDSTFLLQVAEHLSIGINNQKLFGEVLQREREWEDTFRAITDAIVIIDKEYRIIRTNEIARKTFHLESRDVTKEKCYEIIHQKAEPCSTCILTEGDANAKQMSQFIKGLDKHVYDVHAYQVFQRNGLLRGVFEVYKDVTQQVAIEAQLVHSEKLAAIGRLAAGVAHELNSPLTAILGNSQLLMKELTLEPDSQMLMEDIKQCGIRCKTIIQNLLSFARQQQLDSESVRMEEVLNKAIRLVTHQIRQERIELVCKIEEELPEISGNGQQLEQVIINLLINAKDAVQLREENKWIGVSGGSCNREGKDYLYIMVEDNGCGMEAEQISQIFTPFYTTKEVDKGTGLGLAVSQGIVQNHGGSIECESTPEIGTKFTVLLPLK